LHAAAALDERRGEIGGAFPAHLHRSTSDLPCAQRPR
jgi:hypothetical protein